MFICFADRSTFQLLLSPQQRAAEIGVYRGEYSQGLLNRNPSSLSLIDAWQVPDPSQLLPADSHANAQTQLDAAFHDYYPEGIALALPRAESEVRARFAAEQAVSILKMSSAEAVESFADYSLDYVYIDANHRFEFALADLNRWSRKVAPMGYLVLNDVYVSQRGALQFLGVMEAASQFIKLNDWVPLAMNTNSFGDLVLVRKSAMHLAEGDLSLPVQKMLSILLSNGIPFIEVADTTLHSARHKAILVDNQPFEFLSFA